MESIEEKITETALETAQEGYSPVGRRKRGFSLFCEQYLEKPAVEKGPNAGTMTTCTIRGVYTTDDY